MNEQASSSLRPPTIHISTQWRVFKFDKLVEFVTDLTSPKTLDESLDCIELEHIGQNNGRLLGSTPSSAVSSQKRMFRAGDVLFGKLRPYLRKFAFPKTSGICSSEIWVFRAKAELVIPSYLFYLIQSDEFVNHANISCGTKMPRADWQHVSGFTVLVPSKQEQYEIAEILTCWDKAIELVERLIEEKRVRKIALTLKLITGRLRLPKHVKDPSYATTRYGAFPQDWKALKVKDVAEESKLRFDADNNTTVLSCTKHKGLVPSLEYFGKQIFSNDLSNYKVVTLNQFAYATNHIEEGSIGLLTAIKRGLVSPIYTVFQTDTDVDPRFLFAVFKTSLYLHIFQSATSASVDRRGSLRWSEFKEIPLWLPSLPEQRDISQLIALLDTELESLQQYASALTDQKRGLMQKLLTGKIRVKV